MAIGELDPVLRHIRQLIGDHETAGMTDGQLLSHFRARRDEAAFAALLHRHGPMVLGVCCRVLRDPHEADDAFQATFLVLIRNAGSIAKTESVGSWLYGVARRIAVRARAGAAIRASRQRPLVEVEGSGAPAEDRLELAAALDEALQRLPEKYRAPLVLHYLEGKTKEETGRLLGWSEGTVSGRLARARDLLRNRLRQFAPGVAVGAGLTVLARGAVAVPPSLFQATFEAGRAVGAGHGSAVSAAVAALMEGATTTMWGTKMKIVTAVLLVVTLGGAGMGLFGVFSRADEQPDKKPAAAAPTAPQADKELKGDQQKILGTWAVVGAERRGIPITGDQLNLLKPIRFIFTANTLSMEFGEEKKVAQYKLNPAKDPKLFEMDLRDENKKRRYVGSGFYFLTGDTLKLILDRLPGLESLNEFEAQAGAGLCLLVLQRVKGDKAPDKEELAAARDAALRTRSKSNLKLIAIAMHNYHDSIGSFPPSAIYSKDGKPLLSWRVALLPYVDEDKLYQEFKLNEPWDSSHNKKLLARMPKTYAPVGVKTKEPFTTFYQVFTGLGTPFEGTKGSRIADITDGTSNTIMVVEAGEPVPWTKPDDLPYKADKALPKLTGLYPDGFYTVFCDGAVHFIKHKVDEKTIRALITRNGGEVIDTEKLNP